MATPAPDSMQVPGPARSFDELDLVDLGRINDEVNAEIEYVTDSMQFGRFDLWDYPSSYGDCEDCALEKMKRLIDLGWDPAAVLLTIVISEEREPHLVLIVKTAHGDLVLDNRIGQIKPWTETPHRRLMQQNPYTAGTWNLLAANG